MAAPGYTIRAAFGSESAGWPPTSVAPSQLTPVFQESVAMKTDHEGVVRVDQTTATQIVGRRVEGSIAVQMQYEGLEAILYSALGFYNPNGPTVLGTLSREHTFECDPILRDISWQAGEGWIADGGLIAGDQKCRHLSYLVDKGPAIWESSGVFITDWTLTSSPGILVALDLSVVGYATNLFSAYSLDLDVQRSQPVAFRQLAWSLGTELQIVNDIVGWSCHANNNIEVLYDRDNFIKQPTKNGPTILEGSFAIPLYTAQGTLLQTWSDSGTSLVACAEFIGGSIEDDINYTLKLWFPSVRLTGYDIGVQGPEQLQQVYSFIADATNTNPSGFPESIKNSPVIIQLINTRTTRPF